jgi:hypothetical protein
MNPLQKQWNEVCNKYLKRFCTKHDFEFNEAEAWVRNETGEMACVSDLYFNMTTIRYDVDNNVSKEKLLQWYDYVERLTLLDCPHKISYESWCKGAPKPYSEEQLRQIESCRKKVEDAKQQLFDLINNSNDSY